MEDGKFIIDEESQKIIDYFYNVIPTEITLPDGSKKIVPNEGNIGLLAMGYKGIVAWRKKREQDFGSRLYSPYVVALNEYLEKNKPKEEQ